MTRPVSDPPVVMIDYGGSNLRSAQKALEAVGARVEVTADPDVVRRASKLVLPGVGAFGAGMDALRARGLAGATVEAVERGALLLGICLGMQFLFDGSEEMGSHEGLGLLTGRVVRFDGQQRPSDAPKLKVPHIGWNRIVHDERSALLAGVPSGSHAYFVHSYYCAPGDSESVLATADYGGPFAAIVGRERAGRGYVYGIQFHPEKSQSVGLRILRNFAAMEAISHAV